MRHPGIYADSELCTAGDKRQIFSQSIPENGCSVKESPIPEDSGITELFDLPDERGIFAYADGAPVSISFQGGEPLLAGKEFFRAAEKILGETDTKGSPLFVGVQTNGTLVDEEWCDIFARNGWLVGLSLDGDEAANAYRVYDGGKPAFGCRGTCLHSRESINIFRKRSKIRTLTQF